MSAQATVTINGRLYDSATGVPLQTSPIPVPAADPQPSPQPVTQEISVTSTPPSAHAIHQKPQKSQTLHRAVVQRPQSTVKHVDIMPQAASNKHIIRKFAPQPVQHTPLARRSVEPQLNPQNPSVQPTQAQAETVRPHPLVQQIVAAQQRRQAAATAPAPTPLNSSQLKEQLIRQQLAAAQPNTGEHQEPKKGLFARRPRLASVLTASLAMLVLGGYLTYFNLPSISMRVAATRAGIAADLPQYQPEGYRFAGPITYAPGEVSATYKSTGGDNTYTIQQKSSNWDSQAVLHNYVLQESRVYLTYQEHGLTIYSFGNGAAWVNGGILYTIDGNAPLSSEQLLNIATSM